MTEYIPFSSASSQLHLKFSDRWHQTAPKSHLQVFLLPDRHILSLIHILRFLHMIPCRSVRKMKSGRILCSGWCIMHQRSEWRSNGLQSGTRKDAGEAAAVKEISISIIVCIICHRSWWIMLWYMNSVSYTHLFDYSSAWLDYYADSRSANGKSAHR